MSKRNSLITALLIISLVAVIAYLGIGVLRQQELNSSSREMAVDLTQRILSRDPMSQVPNSQLLLDNAHSLLLNRRSDNSNRGYIDLIFRNLGDLEVVEAISGSSQIPYLMFDDAIPSADYTLDATFTKGPGEVRILLLFEQGRWLIEDFRVESNRMVL